VSGDPSSGAATPSTPGRPTCRYAPLPDALSSARPLAVGPEAAGEDRYRAQVDVHLLGPLLVTGPDGPVSVGAQKERAVCAALALRVGRVVSAGELVDALWGAEPPTTAVKTLQGYVSKLRRALGPGIVGTVGQGYVLRLPPDAVDVVHLHRLVGQARAAMSEGRAAAAVDHYAEALALWRGEPLPDLLGSEIGRSEAARLDEIRCAVQEEQLEARIALGEHQRTIPDLEALVSEAPLRERAWELLMLALYRAGRQADALRAFQRVRTLLIDQIGVEPGPRIKGLEAAIIAHDPRLDLATADGGGLAFASAGPARAPAGSDGLAADASAPLPTSIGWASSSAFPFAGREVELGQIRGAWSQTLADEHRRAVVIGGDPGIGKTRLVAEAALTVADSGGIVLFGRCEEGLGAPYQPFVEALGAFVAACPTPALEQLVGPLGGELTRLLLELRSRLPDLDQPVAAEPETERHRLFEAVSELLEKLCARQPVFLVLDDLQWATTPTLLLLRHILTTTRPARLLVTGTYRTTELDRVYPLADVLADLRRHEHVQRINLDGLDERSTISLIMSAADHRIASDGLEFLRRVHRESGGNPFFFWAILTHLVETGMIVRREGRWTQAVDTLEISLPEGIREVVSRRLSSLNAEANAILRVAALVGNDFDHRVVAQVAGVSENDAIDTFDLALQAGIVVEVPEVYGRYAFTHDLIRRSLEEELSTTRRVRLHWQIGEVLAGQYGEDDRDHLDELARHYTEGALAGDANKACDMARRAGDAALEALAFEEAAAYYDDALTFAEPDDHDRRYVLFLSRGKALQRAGSHLYREVVEQAVAIARRQGDAHRFAVAATELQVHAYLNIGGVNDPELRSLLQEALDGLGDSEPAMWARIASMLALTLSLSEQRERAIALSEDAVSVARESGDDRVLAQVLIDHIWVISGPDTLDQRLALAQEVAGLADHRDHISLINAHNCLNQAWFELGDLEAGERSLADGLSAAEFLRQPVLAWGFQAHEAALSMVRGDVEELERRADALLARGTEVGVQHDTVVAVYSRLLFAARFEQGALGEFEAALEELVKEQPDLDWTIALGVVYAETGRLREARAILDQLRGHAVKRDLTWFPLMMLQSLVVAEVGDVEMAHTLYDELAPYAGRNSYDGAGTCGPVDLGLGRLAAVLGRLADAERHFDASLTTSLAWRSPIWSAHTYYEHARALSPVPEMQPRVRELVTQCTTVASSTGQTRLINRAKALTAR
jgi:DNA-binding SARP family transcriptional activator